MTMGNTGQPIPLPVKHDEERSLQLLVLFPLRGPTGGVGREERWGSGGPMSLSDDWRAVGKAVKRKLVNRRQGKTVAEVQP